MEPPPDEADVPNIQNGEPTSVEAFLDTGAGTNEEASAGSAAKCPAQCQASPGLPPSQPARSSQQFVNAACARWAITGTAAHEHADGAQYHHQDGTETATMVELRTT